MKKRITLSLNIFQDILYGIIALALAAAAILVLYSVFQSFIHTISQDTIASGIIHIIDNILLCLMIAEILYTVTISFESHSLKCEPFLIVGLIASIRRILLISLEAAHVTSSDPELFQNFMLELGILSILVLIFVFSIYLLRKQKVK